MATITLHIPNAQMKWFEQMLRTMGWSYETKETTDVSDSQTITPAMRRAIKQARIEAEKGEVAVCRTPQEMQQFFDTL